MKKMIDELWDGEISPQDTLISDNQEYRELQHRQSQNKTELLEALSDEQITARKVLRHRNRAKWHF